MLVSPRCQGRPFWQLPPLSCAGSRSLSLGPPLLSDPARDRSALKGVSKPISYVMLSGPDGTHMQYFGTKQSCDCRFILSKHRFRPVGSEESPDSSVSRWGLCGSTCFNWETTASRRSCLRPVMVTVAPLLLNAMAAAFPIPAEPPEKVHSTSEQRHCCARL